MKYHENSFLGFGGLPSLNWVENERKERKTETLNVSEESNYGIMNEMLLMWQLLQFY